MDIQLWTRRPPCVPGRGIRAEFVQRQSLRRRIVRVDIRFWTRSLTKSVQKSPTAAAGHRHSHSTPAAGCVSAQQHLMSVTRRPLVKPVAEEARRTAASCRTWCNATPILLSHMALPQPQPSPSAHLLVVHKLMEEADGVGAAADAGQQHVRDAAELLLALPPHLLADDRLEVPHLPQHHEGQRPRRSIASADESSTQRRRVSLCARTAVSQPGIHAVAMAPEDNYLTSSAPPGVCLYWDLHGNVACCETEAIGRHLTAHHHGVRVRPRGGAEDVVRRLHVGHPVPDGLAGRVLQRRGPCRHWPHLDTEPGQHETGGFPNY